MIQALRIVVGAALLVWASWVGYLLGYAAAERRSLDRDCDALDDLPPTLSEAQSRKAQGWGVPPGVRS